MNITDCEGVRIRLMASIDGEGEPVSVEEREHVSRCPSCRSWLKNFELLTAQLQDLSYQDPRADLWVVVNDRIRQSDQRSSLMQQLWPIGVMAIGWRALQLFVDLPIPALHTLVPLAAAVLVAWRLGSHLLTIETWAPELEKRGI